MTRAQVAELARCLIGEPGNDWIASTAASAYDLNEAITQAYNEYAQETACFPVEYALAATAEKAVYRYDEFGTGSPKSGGRMFQLTHVAYDSRELDPATINTLQQNDADWRFAASGVPRYWLPEGERRFRLWPKPNGTENISVMGYEIPDPALTDTDAESFDIAENDCRLLALGALKVFITRDPTPDNAARAASIYAELQAGWAAARKRIHGIGAARVVLGSGPKGYGPLTILDRITPAI